MNKINDKMAFEASDGFLVAEIKKNMTDKYSLFERQRSNSGIGITHTLLYNQYDKLSDAQAKADELVEIYEQGLK